MVTKSTVPVGTSVRIKTVVNEELKRRGVNIPFDVASNPEFLKEGNAIKDFMSPHTILLSCLNGIESETILRQHFSKDQVIRCIVQGMDSTYLNNTVDFSHVGQILFGAENENQKALVDALEVFFEQYRIPYRRCENIYRDQWNKLMLNCGINQVCAAHQTGYGGCQNGGAYQKEFIMAMKEVQKVARAKGIDLKDQDIEDLMKAFCTRYGFRAPVMVYLYGKRRLMIMKHCVINTLCKDGKRTNCALCHTHTFVLQGKDGQKYRLMGDAHCHMCIFENEAYNALSKREVYQKMGVPGFAVFFLDEATVLKDKIMEDFKAPA